MDDLISRKAAIDLLMKWSGGYDYIETETESAIKEFQDLPSAQRPGRWKVSDLPKGKMKYCSECGFGQYIADERQYNFCPNCGARMGDL